MKPLLMKVVTLLVGAWRYRWQGLAAAWLVCLAGWLGVWSIADQYAVQAKIYIDTDTVLGPLMRGLTVSQDQDQQINIMLQKLTSRPNLEQIIHLVNADSAHYTAAQMEQAVNTLHANITMQSAGVKNLFSIGYVDNNSAYAEAVTQSLISILIDSEIGDGRQDMSGARSFIDQKIAEYETKMREAEKRRSDFKAANLDVIGTVGAAGTMDGAMGELQAARNDLAAAEITVSSLRSQLAGVPSTVASDQLPTLSDRGVSGGSSNLVVRLQQSEQALLDLRSRYTDDYPDIVALKQTIAELNKEVAAAAADSKGIAPTNGAGVPNPIYVDLRTKLSAAEVQLALIQHRVAVADERVSTSKKNANEILAINNKYQDLDRDYNVFAENYQALVKSREAANMSQSMSEQQQAISFRIIEPAKRTLFPVAPKRPLLNSAVLLLGIAAGVALALGLSLFGGRFTTSEELANYFSLPVLGVVTAGPNVIAARRARTAIAAVSVGVIALVLMYGAVTILLTTSIYSKLGI